MTLDLVVPRIAGAARGLLGAALHVRAVASLEPARRRSASLFATREIAAELVDRLGVEVTVRGTPPTEQALIVANHLSWLDPFLVLPTVPCVCLAKREVFDWPIIGEEARNLGVVMVDRRDAVTRAVALRRAWRVLQNGWTVLNFPEGTTSFGDEVLPFRRGLFGAACALSVPVVPLHIAYEERDACWVGDSTFLPHFVRMVGRPRTRATLTFGSALSVRANDDATILSERARAALSRALPS